MRKTKKVSTKIFLWIVNNRDFFFFFFCCKGTHELQLQHWQEKKKYHYAGSQTVTSFREWAIFPAKSDEAAKRDESQRWKKGLEAKPNLRKQKALSTEAMRPVWPPAPQLMNKKRIRKLEWTTFTKLHQCQKMKDWYYTSSSSVFFSFLTTRVHFQCRVIGREI